VCWGWSLSSVELKCCCASRVECSILWLLLPFSQLSGIPAAVFPADPANHGFCNFSLISQYFLLSWNFYRTKIKNPF